MDRDFNPTEKGSRKKLREALLGIPGSGDLSRFCYRLKEHPQRGEMVRLLESLSKDGDYTVRLRSLFVMTGSYPDVSRVVFCLTRAAGTADCWERFLEIVELRKQLSATRDHFINGVLDLMKSHLGNDELVFPLHESQREKEAGLALKLSGFLSRFRKVLKDTPTPQAINNEIQQSFGELYSTLQSELQSRTSKGEWRAPRTRKERIRALLDGEDELTFDLFRMMTSRDGFENLKLLLQRRPEVIRTYEEELRIASPLTDSQVKVLWKLMDDEIRERLAWGIVDKSAPYLEPLTLCHIARASPGSAQLVLESLASDPDKRNSLIGRSELAEEFCGLYPELVHEVWRVFSDSLVPSQEAFPLWEYTLDSSPANAVLEGDHFLLSTEKTLACLDRDSGRLLWLQRGDDLPLVHYPVGKGLYLAQNSRNLLFLVRADESGLEVKVFSGPAITLANAWSPSYGEDFASTTVCIHRDTHYGDGKYQDYLFDFKGMTISKKQTDYSRVEHRSESERLLFPDESRQKSSLPCTPTTSVCEGPDRRILALNHPESENPEYLHEWSKEFVFGFDTTTEKLVFRFWSTGGQAESKLR